MNISSFFGNSTRANTEVFNCIQVLTYRIYLVAYITINSVELDIDKLV
jgi:hypothetical protein